MKTLAILAALLVGFDDHGGKVEWTKDVEKGLSQAAKSGQPAMLLFTADW